MVFVVLCPGTHKGSTGSGSGFKASQKTGQWFNVSSDRQIYYPQLVWEPVIGLIKWSSPKGLKVCSYVEKCAEFKN